LYNSINPNKKVTFITVTLKYLSYFLTGFAAGFAVGLVAGLATGLAAGFEMAMI
jgi:hypothetical protein